MRVDNAALRHAAQRSGLSRAEIARRAGWVRPDGEKVSLALGLLATHNGNGRGKSKYARTSLSYDDAMTLCRAIGVDPVEVGL